MWWNPVWWSNYCTRMYANDINKLYAHHYFKSRLSFRNNGSPPLKMASFTHSLANVRLLPPFLMMTGHHVGNSSETVSTIKMAFTSNNRRALSVLLNDPFDRSGFFSPTGSSGPSTSFQAHLEEESFVGLGPICRVDTVKPSELL